MSDHLSAQPGLNLLGQSGGCCGGSCGCGRGAGDTAAAGPETALAGVEASFLVSGMTCGHCVSSVTEEVGAIEGVVNVNVDLNADGASRVTVQATHPIETDALRTAIADAGYEIVGR
ncbi:MAG: heavy-metal-associated domain-containing protein [Microcella sp.]